MELYQFFQLFKLQKLPKNFTEDDVFDALEFMGIKGEPLTIDQFMDLFDIMKDPEMIIDAFSIFDTDRKGFNEEGELSSMLRKYSPGFKGKRIEKIREKKNLTTNGLVNYNIFIHYWAADQ